MEVAIINAAISRDSSRSMFVSLAHLVVKILVFVRGWGIVGVIIGGVIGRSGRSRVINCAEGGGGVTGGFERASRAEAE